jgi:hypothetical protein
MLIEKCPIKAKENFNPNKNLNLNCHNHNQNHSFNINNIQKEKLNTNSTKDNSINYVEDFNFNSTGNLKNESQAAINYQLESSNTLSQSYIQTEIKSETQIQTQYKSQYLSLSTPQFQSLSKDYSNFNKFFMKLKPLKPYYTENINININLNLNLNLIININLNEEKENNNLNNSNNNNNTYNSPISNSKSENFFQQNLNCLEKNSKKNSIFSRQFNPYYQNPKFFSNKKSIQVEIFSDLYSELISEELNLPICFGYMLKQNQINEKMRAVLIDWLSEVHLKLKLNPETLFLTVNIIDRFLSKIEISKNKLQLLGVGALLIACKFEESNYPDIDYIVYITDKAYCKNDIINFEKIILKTLNYEIIFPSILRFFDLLSLNFNLTEKEYYLGRYFCEIFLMDYRINKYPNSLIACTACYLVLKINKFENYRLVNCFKYNSEKDLKSCAKEIFFLLENIDSTNLISIKNKYCQEDYLEVSKKDFKE